MQTHFIAWRGRLVFAAACCAALTVGITGWTWGQEPDADRPAGVESDPVVKVTKQLRNLKIVERFSKILELDAKITAVDGFDPEVIDVTALTPNRVRVQAAAPGITTMSLFDENKETYTIEVFVAGDVRHLQAHLNHQFPHSAVQAVAVKDSVLLDGWVTQPEQIPQMTEIAEQFYPKVLNHMVVGGPQQVKLKVQVMEVQRSKIRQFGFNFDYNDGETHFASTIGNLVPLTGPGPPLIFNIVGSSATFDAFLDALKAENLLKILAEPELVTTNGRPANMLAGGEFPIQVPQSLGTTTIEWREFGVRLEAVPFILGNGRVRLELAPEVSEKDFTSATEVNGFIVPALTARRVNTQVEMNFGETFMLAGMLMMRKTAETDKVPFLGELPWVGMAFRRVRYEEAETELVIMVTPELVGPLKDCEVPPGGPGLFTTVPTDRELCIDGFIEIPNYGDPCEGGNCQPHDGAMMPYPAELNGHPPTGVVPNGTTLPPAPATTEPAPGPAAAAPATAPMPTSATESLRHRQVAAAAAQPPKESMFQRLNPFRKAPAAGHARKPEGPAAEGAVQQAGYNAQATATVTKTQSTLKFRSPPAANAGLIEPTSP
ncbi:MAG: pilus assembly protein N-terminal domain-containing protein [Planctomycetaceae bacterium]